MQGNERIVKSDKERENQGKVGKLSPKILKTRLIFPKKKKIDEKLLENS